MENFIEKFVEQFEDADTLQVNKHTAYKNLETWDSLTSFSVLAMIEDEYGVNISPKEIGENETIEDLFNLIQNKKAEQ